MTLKPAINVARLLGPDAKRSSAMEALWTWIQEEDAKFPNPETLPIEEQRGLIAKLNERWNVDLPPLAETRRNEISGPAGPIPCEWMVPNGARPGAILYIHGGGWAVCNLDTHRRLARLLAARSGFSVLSVDYRLAPEHPFPAGLKDCAAAWRWLSAKQKGPFLFAGDSAGANLALALALHEIQASRPTPDGLLCFYGAYTANLEGPSYLRFSEGYGLSKARMEQFWDWYAPVEARADPLVAPAEASEAMLAKLPPLFLNAASLDVLLSDTFALAKRLDAAEADYELVMHEGVHHGFMMFSSRLDEANEAIEKAAAFARRFG
jgi:acetyl esterase